MPSPLFSSSPLALLLAAASLTLPALAEDAPLLTDWRPYEQLPEGERAGIAPYCPGGFVDPMQFDERVDPSRPDDSVPLTFQFNRSNNISTESARLIGDVSARRNTFQARAQQIRYERSTGEGDLLGQVQLRSPGALITGDTARLNFDDDTATVEAAHFVLHAFDQHGSAETLRRAGPNRFSGDSIHFTRCMPDDPAWGLRAASLEVDRETGIGKAWHARLEIRSVPVLYTPYISFPIDERRRSGFLTSSYGIGDSGFDELAVPYYLNLAPNLDDTFTLHYFADLGLLARNEFRFLTESHSGISDLDWQLTREAQTTDASSAPRRWALRHRQSGELGERTGYDLDTRLVSDIRYDQNFNNGGDLVEDQVLDLTVNQAIPTGVLRLDNRLTTPVQDSPSNFHTARVRARTRFGSLRTSVLTEWQDPLEADFLPDNPGAVVAEDPPNTSARKRWPLKRLPEIALDYRPVGLPGALTLTGNLTASRFSRQLTEAQSEALEVEAQSDAGLLAAANETNRLYLNAGLGYPLDVEWGYLRPRLEGIGLAYRQSNPLDADFDFAGGDYDTDPSQATWRFTADSRIIAEKPYATSGGPVVHSIEPRLHYTYTPYADQDDLPNLNTTAVDNDFKLFTASRFSGLDRIGDMNRLSMALDSRLRDGRSGEEILFAGVSKGLKLDQERVTEGDAHPALDDPEPEFSPTYLDSRWAAADNLRVGASAQWAHEDGDLQAYSVDITYLPPGERFVRFGLTLDEDAQGAGLSTYWPLRQNLAAIGYVNWARPMLDGEPNGEYRNTDLVYGLDYDACCWNLRLVGFSNLPDTDDGNEGLFPSRPERGVRFEFTLKGLGGSTGSIESLLTDKVPGYRGRMFNTR